MSEGERKGGGKPPPLFDQFNRPLRRSGQDDGETEPTKEASAKDAAQRSEVRKILVAVITWLSGPGAIIALWSYSHQWALWIGATVLVVACCLQWGIGRRSIGLTAIILLTAILTAPRLPLDEKPGQGRLVAGNFDVPKIDCGPERPGARSVYLGGTSRIRLPTDKTRRCMIMIGGHELLAIDQRGDTASVSAEIYDPNGGFLLARIIDNAFRVNPQAFLIERPDLSTLKVQDSMGKEALGVRFLNPGAFYVTGRFYFPGYELVEITDSGMWVGGRDWSGNCIPAALRCAYALVNR